MELRDIICSDGPRPTRKFACVCVGDLVPRAADRLVADRLAVRAVGVERVGVRPVVLELVAVAGGVESRAEAAGKVLDTNGALG
ncbi:MAG: hypothetical protein WD069_19880 [Planctomycetales bacterium]